MMNQLDVGRWFAQQVTALGCRLALDDFGTGFASLSYLKQIPAQLLKIDIEFVRDLTRNATGERLVRAIIGIAREFDQTTVAEGIEDQATLARLRELGVHLGQGYLFGRPQPLSDASPIIPSEVERDRQRGLAPFDVVRSALAATTASADSPASRYNLEMPHIHPSPTPRQTRPPPARRADRHPADSRSRRASSPARCSRHARTVDRKLMWTAFRATPTRRRRNEGSGPLGGVFVGGCVIALGRWDRERTGVVNQFSPARRRS